jgi:hypothetical protein
MKTALAIATAVAVSATTALSQTGNTTSGAAHRHLHNKHHNQNAIIEVLPRPSFFIVTQHGESKTASVEIVNRDTEPLQILKVQYSNSCFRTSLQTNQPGRRYKLSLTVNSNTPPSRQTAQIVLKTSSKKQPTVKIFANAVVRDRVYTLPDRVDFGAIRLSKVLHDPSSVPFLAQTVMVYQNKGTNFNVRAQSSLDCLEVASEPSKTGDHAELTVQVLAERLKPGELNGTIVVRSNDRQFPALRIPVHGTVIN